MNESPKKINFEDFMKIYPPLSEKVDPSTYKTFNKYFKRKEKKEEKNEDEKNNIKDKKPVKNNKIYTIDEKQEILSQEENEKKDEPDSKREEEWYLVNKGIDLQNKKRKRTNDIKTALEIFFNQSDLISKLSKYFSQFQNELLSSPEPSQEHPNKKEENEESGILPKLPSFIKDKNIEEKILSKIKIITNKLTDAVKIIKCPENYYIIRMFEIGEQCYFLLNGRLSILKPVEYKNVKITYEQYFRYIMNLHHNNELNLLEQLIHINRDYINIQYIDNFLLLIKSYFIIKINNDLDNNESFKDFNSIENKLNDFHFTFEDFGLKKNDVKFNITQLKYNNSGNSKSLALEIKKYLKSIFKPSFDDEFVMNQYKFLFSQDSEKDLPGLSLFKYEIFICLFPGAFFGETALENTSKRRNASIRTEEECIILSLNNDTYGSLLSDDSKRLKALDVSFICDNFFFGNISPILFNKYYFPFFKAISKKKDESLYNQGDEMTSLFLLREGEVKFEVFCSVVELYNIIKSYIFAIEKNNHFFKLSDKTIKNLKESYLNDSFYFSLRNKNDAFKDQLKQKQKMVIYLCNTYDLIGLNEYFLEINYNSTCYVNSLGAKLMEITKYNLETILNSEKQILPSYYIVVCNKLLSEIKRLNNIKEDYIKQIEKKIVEKNYDDSISMNYIIKGQAGSKKPYIRERVKVKPLFSDETNYSPYKYNNLISESPKKFNNSIISSKKFPSIRKDISKMPSNFFNESNSSNKISDLYLKTSNILENSKDNFVKVKYNSYGKYSLKDTHKKILSNFRIVKEDNKIPNLFYNKGDENSATKKNHKKDDNISATIVNCGRKFLSLNQIKIKLRNISQDMYQFNKIKTDQQNSYKKDINNQDRNQSFFYKNNLGLSQSNFRYDLLNAGNRLKAKEINKPYISYISFGSSQKKIGPNSSPISSKRVTFWKNKQVNNFEEIKRFNPKNKLMNTMFVDHIETKTSGKNTFINNQVSGNNTFLLNQVRDFRDY